MKSLPFILFSILAIQSFGQALTWEGEDLENKFYYPSKKVFIDNKVKFKIDSNIYQLPRGYWVEAFDKQGRLIGSFSHSIDSFSNPYRYIEKGDTLLRIRLRDKDVTIYMIERFIYNQKGQIIQFDRFHDDFLNEGRLQLYRTIFFYENNRVVARLRYSLEREGRLTESYSIETNSMTLWSVKQYAYKRTKLHTLMILQEKAGEPDFRDIDTFTYDNKQRLIKHTNFAKSAYFIHNSVVNDRRIIESYEYKNDSVFIQSYTTNSRNRHEQPNIDYKIRIFNKEGLEIRNYHGYTKEKIEPYDRMRYVYF